jgi:CelD/BcsL family acetyltransferase involved in cellulose biosynthesis
VNQCVSRQEQSLDIDVLRTLASIEDIAVEWRDLATREYPGHPFSDPDWIIPWLECFSREQDIRVLVVRENKAVKAIVPLVLARKEYYGISVKGLGIPFNDHTPRCDILVSGGGGDVLRRVLETIKSWSKEWDILAFPQVSTDGKGYDVAKQYTKASGIRSGEWIGPVSPYLVIEGEWDAYYKKLRGKRRAKLRSRLHRLEEHGAVEVEIVSKEADLALALEDGFRIEAAAWKGVNGTAIQSDSYVRAFYTKLAYRMAERGWLRLFFLSVGGNRIAFAYMLECGNKIFALKQGYEPEFSAMSPSTLLVIETLKYAFENGISEYDFLGVDDPWKLEWSNNLRQHSWLFGFSGSPKSVAIYSIKSKILPWLKRVKNRYRSFSEKAV